MARIRSDQPDGLETATDVNAETAETTSAAPAMAPETAEDAPQEPADGSTDDQPAEDDGAAQRPKYRVLRGINYPAGDSEKRAEPGDEVDDLPEGSVAWLLADGTIERI